MFIVCSVSFGTGLRVESPSDLDRSTELIDDTIYALWEDSSNLDHDNFNDEDLQSSGLPSGTPSASAYGSRSVEPLALLRQRNEYELLQQEHELLQEQQRQHE